MIKINYKKHFDDYGYIYRQTITIDKKVAFEFYEQINLWKILNKNDEKLKNSYLNELHTGINYLSMTTLSIFKKYIDYNYHIYSGRIKEDRNTILIIL